MTRADGTNPVQEGQTAPDYHACQSCKHGQHDFATDGQFYKQIQPCYLPKVANSIGNILTSVDVGADGHMASGEALLKCNGYEPKE
jgi:hypothetical protein